MTVRNGRESLSCYAGDESSVNQNTTHSLLIANLFLAEILSQSIHLEQRNREDLIVAYTPRELDTNLHAESLEYL